MPERTPECHRRKRPAGESGQDCACARGRALVPRSPSASRPPLSTTAPPRPSVPPLPPRRAMPAFYLFRPPGRRSFSETPRKRGGSVYITVMGKSPWRPAPLPFSRSAAIFPPLKQHPPFLRGDYCCQGWVGSGRPVVRGAQGVGVCPRLCPSILFPFIPEIKQTNKQTLKLVGSDWSQR